MVSTIPAIPGRVSTAPIDASTPKSRNTLAINAMFAIELALLL